jgi:dynein heavy chain, axonemal
MVDKVVSNSEKYNRSICSSFDTILKLISQPAETPDECVDAIKYLENVNEYELYKLKVSFSVYLYHLFIKDYLLTPQDQLKISAENVLFLMDYAFLKKEDIILNNITFRWTNKIQPLLKAKETQLLKEKEIWIYKLRERRGKFSLQINECLGKVKEFKQKDRVAEAEIYIGELEQISNSIEEFNKEVENKFFLLKD